MNYSPPVHPTYLPAPPVAAARPRRNKTLLIVLAVLLAVVVGLCSAAVFLLRREAPDPEVVRAGSVAARPLSGLGGTPLPPEADRVYKGSGSKVVRLPAAATGALHLVVMTHNGSGGFAVTSVNDSGQIVGLLGHGYGKYRGTMMLDSREQPTALRVRATGSWQVVIRDARKAPTWTGKGSGTTSTVLQVDPAAVPASTTVRYSHRGEGNFVVRSYDYRSWDLLVNEIGKLQVDTELPAGTRFVEIEADGAWTFNRRS